jgi:hypothetical protein
MPQVIHQHCREENWNENPSMANMRKRISIISRRKRVLRFVGIVFIIALGIGVIKEAAHLLTIIYR